MDINCKFAFFLPKYSILIDRGLPCLAYQTVPKRKGVTTKADLGDSNAMTSWRASVATLSSVAEARTYLHTLHTSALAAAEESALLPPSKNGDGGAQCVETMRQWAASWVARLRKSVTASQVGLRAIELRTALGTYGGMKPCTKLQVSVEDENGKLEWARAVVVAVWEDGSFRGARHA
eukprot:4859957-Pleurochrysis_carterae.AAC.1